MNKLFTISIFLLLTFAQNSLARDVWLDHKEVCEKGRGNWRLYNNSCANNCESQVDILVCTADHLYSCDCGSSRCWDGNKCVSFKSYKIKFDEAKEEQRKEDEARKLADVKELEKENKEIQDKINKAQDKALEAFNQQKASAPTLAPSKKEEPVKTDNGQAVSLEKALDQIVPSDIDPTKGVEKILNGISGKEGACKQAGGTWQQFNNGCVDSCSSKVSAGSICTTAITFGCECGDRKCWDSATDKCVVTEDYRNSVLQANQNKSSQNKTLQNNQNNQKSSDDSDSGFGKSLDFLTN